MIALKITDIKDFMNKLLIGEIFDYFETAEVSITTFNTFTIDGRLRKDFFDTDTSEILDQHKRSCSLWKELKPYCYSIIRGKRTPLNFRIIFQLSGSQMETVFKKLNLSVSPDSVSRLFLNLQYRNKELFCTTGIAMQLFLPDKTLETYWDTAMTDFFRSRKILFEEV